MDDSNTDSSKLSISEIVERYNNDDSFFPEKAIPVNISTEKTDNNRNSLAVNNPKGNCWIIHIKNLSFFLPGKKNKFNSYEFPNLKHFFDFEGDKENGGRNFIVEKPAIVIRNGQDWRLQTKGTLNFSKESLSLSSDDLQEKSKQEISKYIKIEQENQALKEENKNLTEQLEKAKEKNISINNKQLNIDVNSLKQSILGEISYHIPQEPSIDLRDFKNEIINEISDRIPQQSSIDLEAFKQDLKQEILNEISDRDIKFDNKLESFKEKLLGETSDRTSQEPNIDSNAFKQDLKQEILQEISDRDIKFDNNLESLKEKLLGEIRDRIPQQPNIDLESFKQEIRYKVEHYEKKLNKLKDLKDEIIKEISVLIPQQPAIDVEYIKELIRAETREGKQKKKNDIESFHEPISLKELQSLIESYNSSPGLLVSESTMVAATRESIEQRRTGFNTPIIFTQTDNDSYWIVNKKLLVEDNYFYLVPKANLIINSRIYQTIEDIFVCQNYAKRSSNKFQLDQPAIVKLITDSEDYEEKWELVEPGKLNFS